MHSSFFFYEDMFLSDILWSQLGESMSDIISKVKVAKSHSEFHVKDKTSKVLRQK